MIILTAFDLEKEYGGLKGKASTRALNGISLNIEKGEILGIMGASGSGKTTLLNILGGIDIPSAGFVKIGNDRIDEMTKSQKAKFRRQKLGYVFQNCSMMDSLSIKENIMLPMILDKQSPETMEQRVNDLMQKFNISDISDKLPFAVSGGQLQKTAICRALVNNPEIIFADEPTGNLDSKSSKSIMECFEKMNADTGNTILIVTHDCFVASFSTRVIFIKDGKLNCEIVKKSDRKEFMNKIMDCLSVLNGENYDI